jgi:hypothetical protein
MPAFRALDFVSRLPNRQLQGANRRKSPATPANIPVLQRLSAETGFDHDCRLRAAVKFAVISSSRRAYWEPSVRCCLPRVVAWQILPLRLLMFEDRLQGMTASRLFWREGLRVVHRRSIDRRCKRLFSLLHRAALPSAPAPRQGFHYLKKANAKGCWTRRAPLFSSATGDLLVDIHMLGATRIPLPPSAMYGQASA